MCNVSIVKDKLVKLWSEAPVNLDSVENFVLAGPASESDWGGAHGGAIAAAPGGLAEAGRARDGGGQEVRERKRERGLLSAHLHTSYASHVGAATVPAKVPALPTQLPLRFHLSLC